MRHHDAGVDFAGVDKSARCGKGGHCRSGQCGTMWQGWTMQEWSDRHYGYTPMQFLHAMSHNMGGGAHTATLNNHLRGDSDDDDDGIDEDVAQTTDQTPPQNAAVTSEPATAHPTTAAKCV